MRKPWKGIVAIVAIALLMAGLASLAGCGKGPVWSALNSGTASMLYGVWGSSPSDVFAVGNVGTILHYNGSAWSAMSSGTTRELVGVWGNSATDVFAGGALYLGLQDRAGPVAGRAVFEHSDFVARDDEPGVAVGGRVEEREAPPFAITYRFELFVEDEAFVEGIGYVKVMTLGTLDHPP
jgi:hypothetical protein